jgi:hypothetical protein
MTVMHAVPAMLLGLSLTFAAYAAEVTAPGTGSTFTP